MDLMRKGLVEDLIRVEAYLNTSRYYLVEVKS